MPAQLTSPPAGGDHPKAAGARRALVLGGTGAVGAEVLRGLRGAGVPSVFTYFRGGERAAALQGELGYQAVQLDLRDRAAARAWLRQVTVPGPDGEGPPDVLIHCAAVSQPAPLAQVTDQDWDEAVAVAGGAAFLACQELLPRLTGGGDVVLLGALDRSQSLPLPVPFAAAQGMLAALCMSLAKELGPRGVRVNVLALGVLSSGLSRTLSDKHLQEYQRFSALRRPGTVHEAARAALWLALENRYMSGKVLSVNGGI